MADDLRIAEWSLRASAGTTTRLVFTSTEALASLSVYTGGTVDDVDDLSGATQHAATLSGGNLIATVDLAVPTGGSVPLRLDVDGAVVTVGRLIPSTNGTADPAESIGLVAADRTYALTVPGIVVLGGGGGGAPSGPAGGVLGGTYPNPSFAADMATQAELDAVAGTIPNTEAIQDVVGGMVTGGTETGIAVSYDDTNGRLDFVAEVTQAELDAEAALARNADNLTSGTVADARIPSTIARDAEVAAGYQPLDSDLTALAVAGNSGVLAATTASFTTADKTKLDGIETAATADQTAAEILTALLTVDGASSGLDADLLDGNEATAFATAAQGTLADSATQPGDDAANQGSGAAADGLVLTADGVGGAAWEASVADGDKGDITVSGGVWTIDAGAVTAAKVAGDVATQAELDALAAASVSRAAFPVVLGFAISDETTALTTGTKLTARAPFAFTLTAVRASLSTPSSAGITTFDINEEGVSVLSTKLTVDANEKTSVTAAAAAVISDSAIADDAELTFDIDVAGTGAKGAKIWLIGTRVL